MQESMQKPDSNQERREGHSWQHEQMHSFATHMHNRRHKDRSCNCFWTHVETVYPLLVGLGIVCLTSAAPLTWIFAGQQDCPMRCYVGVEHLPQQ